MRTLKAIHILLVGAGVGSMILLGYFKEDWLEQWAVSFTSWVGGNTHQGAGSISEFLLFNRKLMATSLMSLVYLMLNLVFVWAITRSSFWVRLTAGLVGALMGASFGVYVAGIQVTHPELWWKTAQDIKMLVQSPFPFLFVLIVFYWLHYSGTPNKTTD